MVKKHSTRVALLACASVASLGLLVGVSPASAKVKKKTVTRTATLSQCVNVSLPYSSTTDPAIAVNPVTNIPTFRGLPQNGTITAITSVGVRISHTFVSDNAISLISPGGRVINLFLHRDNGTDDFGTGATNCGGTLTLFSDTAGTAIAAGTPPYAGSFRPEQPLSAVVGGPAAGLWALVVSDNVAADSGTVHAFSLNFTYSYLALVKKKKKK